MGKISEFKTKKKNRYDVVYECICDECKKEFKTLKQAFIQGQKRHPGICLCRCCANVGKYKKTCCGKLHGLYKHGLNSNGYRRIRIEGKMIYEHRYIASRIIGRKLLKREQVHHIDMNILNNEEENLLVTKNLSEHNLYHYQMEKIGISLLGKCILFDESEKIYKLIEDDIKKVNFEKLYNVKIGGKYKYKRFEGINRSLHTYLIEKSVGRKLFSNECVHHVDMNKRNNLLENLFLMTKSDHRKAHFTLQRCVGKLVEKGIVRYDRVNKKYAA